MLGSKPYVVELKDYQGMSNGLLPAIRRTVQELRRQQDRPLQDIGLSRRGDKIYLHLYFEPERLQN